jgi:hypothetical protein
MTDTFHRLVQLGACVWNQSVTFVMTDAPLVIATAVIHSTVPLVVVTPDGELVNDKDTLAFACDALNMHTSTMAHKMPEKENRLRINSLMWHVSGESIVSTQRNQPARPAPHHAVPVGPNSTSQLNYFKAYSLVFQSLLRIFLGTPCAHIIQTA